MRVSVLIPDGESHLLIFVINSLSQIKGIEIHVMSNVKFISMRSSRYIASFAYYPKTENEQLWITNVNNVIIKHKIDLVMPIFENCMETIIKHKKSFVGEKLCLLPDLVNFGKARNKWLLTQHLLLNNIPFPKSVLYSPNESLTLTLENLRFPIIIKPVIGSGGGDGVYLFQNRDELESYLHTKKFDCAQIIQEYVKGYDIGCSVLCKSGNILAFTIQKATMLNSNPFKPWLGVEFVYEEDLYAIVERLMKSLTWYGVAHIDLKYDVDNQTFKIIEVNTRFWGSLDASLIAGVNFPHLYCLASKNESFETPQYKNINYLNLKGLAKTLFKDKSLLFDFNFIMKNTPVGFALKDPLPIIFKYMVLSKNVFFVKLKAKFKIIKMIQSKY